MKRLLLITCLCTLSMCAAAHTAPTATEGNAGRADSVIAGQPFKGTFYCAETRVSIILDLYEQSIKIPGYDFFGQTNGYMRGNTNADLYGIWMLTDFKIKGKTALLRFSNDMGSDSQTIEFTEQSDGTFRYKTTGGNEIRKAVKRKLVKISDTMVFKRK